MRDSKLSWQKILAQGFATANELLAFLQLPPTLGNRAAEDTFKTRVPRSYAQRMQPGNARDPLLLQVLAVSDELRPHDGFEQDPLAEKQVNPITGLMHKYHGRVLLTVTGACAINCRYCFRRHFPYDNNNPGREGWQQAIDYIAQDASIHEVILSGGDPLLASNTLLITLLEHLSAINHVKTVRFHTRIPVVLPERIDTGFLQLLRKIPCNKVMVLHCNHANELSEQVAHVCYLLREAGCLLLNQSVLLAGVNDDAQVLASLSERLFASGVLPYYLHLLDKVQGAAHFDIPKQRAITLYHELQALVPGYLVPKLAREEPGKKNKTLFA